MQQNCSIDQKDSGIFIANENKTKWVTIITLVTMVVEVAMGYWSGSMALLADGWHMASHTMALFMSLVVYYLYRHPKFRSSFTFGGGKIISLGGYTSALFLILIAGSMIIESFMHFFKRSEIHYNEALVVAVIGLVVNLICAYILHDGHDHSHGHSHSHSHGHDHHDHSHCSHGKGKLAPTQHQHAPVEKIKVEDHNREGAYVHILTDALTSVLAIFALIMGKWQGWDWLDPLVGILGGVVVLKWSFGLIRQSGMDLLDAHDVSINRDQLVETLEKDGSKVVDIHLWKLAPGQIGGEIVIKRNHNQLSADYRDMVQEKFDIQHLVIEVV